MTVSRTTTIYLLKFATAFCLLYFGTKGIIGLSTPGDNYSLFVAQYLDFVTPVRYLLLYATKGLLSIFGVQTHFDGPFNLRIAGGKGVYMAYGCIGYGVISFWLAFIFANKGSFSKKAAWMIVGGLLLCAINIGRIALLLQAINKGWPIPLGWDHHTWFNIIAYGCIFAIMFAYDKASAGLFLRQNQNLSRIGSRPNSSPEAVTFGKS